LQQKLIQNYGNRSREVNSIVKFLIGSLIKVAATGLWSLWLKKSTVNYIKQYLEINLDKYKITKV